ncbi:MAG: accessory factor UbiK family protein [Gammaproteobacteria bacterium]|nr:accessory factor UbiK family protein [Gammaproteobacteria bacterium]
MFDPKILDDIAKKFSDALPGGLKDLQADLEKNVRSAVQGGLSRLDLVTREEFEVQSQVLAKTRAKLEALERQIEALEKRES